MILTPKELATRWACTVYHIYKLCREDKLPSLQGGRPHHPVPTLRHRENTNVETCPLPRKMVPLQPGFQWEPQRRSLGTQ